MKSSSSNSTFYGVFAFLIVAGSFLIAWKFILPNYQENKQKAAQLDVDIKYAKTKLDSLNTTKSSLFDLGDTVNQMLVSMPGDKDAPNLITELEAIGNTYGIVIPSIQISEAESAAATDGIGIPITSSNNKVSVSFPASGKFEDIGKFIAALENDIRFMNINSLTLNKQEAKEGETSEIMGLSVSLTAYKYIDTSLSSTMNTSFLSNETTE